MSCSDYSSGGKFLIQMTKPSENASAGQALKFIKNSLHCEYKITSINEQEHLRIICPRCEEEVTVGHSKVGNGEIRSDAGINACLKFVQNMKDESFFRKVVEFSLDHAWYSETLKCKKSQSDYHKTAIYLIRKTVPSKHACANLALKYIKNSLHCQYKFQSTDDEEQLMIFCKRCGEEKRISHEEVINANSRTDAGIKACLNFIQRMHEDSGFFIGIIRFALDHGWHSEASRCKYETK